jgi:DNA primase
VDLVDVVGTYLTLQRAGALFKGLCPFHEEKTPSFNVNPARQTYKCFGCGAGGDVFTFVQQKERIDFLEARRMLADRAGISLESERRGGSGSGGPGRQDLARVNAWAQQLFRKQYAGPDGAEARAYVARRGISDEMAEAFGLGLAVDSFEALVQRATASRIDVKLLAAAGVIKERQSGGYYDTFRNRLMFPIVDGTGRIIGFGGRTLGDDPAKYLNTPATALFDKSRSLFGLDRVRAGIDAAGRAIVVEGYTDCIMAHQFGFTETVATLGTAMTDEHAAILRRYTDRVILLFDSDEAGQRAADRALGVSLSSGLDVALARVPEGKDPCDFLLSAGKSGFSDVLNQGVGALEFKWRRVSREVEETETGPGRRRAIEAYLQQLSAWFHDGAIDQIQQGLLVNQLSKILSLSGEDLLQQLRRLRPSGQLRRRVEGSAPSAGNGSTSGRMGTVPSAEQRALCQMLEVLLNEPGLYPEVADCFTPAVFADSALSAIAEVLVDMLSSGEPFRIDELIGRLELPAYGKLITDLQDRGERRGAYGETIAGARRCLESYDRSRTAGAIAQEIRRARYASPGTVNGVRGGRGERSGPEASGPEPTGTERSGADEAASELPVEAGSPEKVEIPTGEDERLLALADSARQPHFSTARARLRIIGMSGRTDEPGRS